jgi:signal-transduction protein with cAMP-binding, CBS, and nucleotidyltransferase domain
MKKQTLIDKAFLLKRTSLFGGLDLDLLLAIADKLGAVEFDPGELIFPYGQDAHRMYFVAKGSVVLKDFHHVPLVTLSVADYFGDESLFNEKPRGYEAFSQTESLLLTLSKSHLMMIISEFPPVALGFLHDYASEISYRNRKNQRSIA